jgi:hypothetical protein
VLTHRLDVPDVRDDRHERLGRRTAQRDANLAKLVPVDQSAVVDLDGVERLTWGDARRRRGRGAECPERPGGEIDDFDSVLPFRQLRDDVAMEALECPEFGFSRMGPQNHDRIDVADSRVKSPVTTEPKT